MTAIQVFVAFLIIQLSNVHSATLIQSLADTAFSASSEWDGNCAASAAKFDQKGWCSKDENNQWIKVDLGDKYVIEQISTKGSFEDKEWVETYTLQYSITDSSYTNYPGTFTGNSDKDTENPHTLSPIIIARYLRFHPQTWNSWPAMRIEADGYLWVTPNPTLSPTPYPSNHPTKQPTSSPTYIPTKSPTYMPTKMPTQTPTQIPTKTPTKSPILQPTKTPTKSPTLQPTISPTGSTIDPSQYPTESPVTPHPTTISNQEVMYENTDNTDENKDVNRDDLKTDEQKGFGSLFVITGFGIGACLCLFLFLFILKRRRKKRRMAQDNKLPKHVPAIERIVSQSFGPRFVSDEVMMTSIHMHSNENIHSAKVNNGATNMVNNEGEFGSNLSNITGANNVLMNDILDEMGDNDIDTLIGSVTVGGGPDMNETPPTNEIIIDDDIHDNHVTPPINLMNMINTAGNDYEFEGNVNIDNDMVINGDDHTPNKRNSKNGEATPATINYNNNYNKDINNGYGYEDVDDINIGNTNQNIDEEVINDINFHVTAGGPVDNDNNNYNINNNDEYEDVDDIENIDDNIDETDEEIMDEIEYNVTAGGPVANNNYNYNSNINDDEVIQ